MTNSNNIKSGIFFMLAASAFIGGTAIVAKLLGKNLIGEPLTPFQISHSRFLYGLFFYFFFRYFINLKFKI